MKITYPSFEFYGRPIPIDYTIKIIPKLVMISYAFQRFKIFFNKLRENFLVFNSPLRLE